MMRYLRWLFLTLLGLAAAGGALAAVDGAVLKTLALDAPPVDLTVSADGRRVFVLMAGGTVQIYAADGRLEGELQVQDGTERISVSPQGELLYLTSRTGKNLQIAALDYIQTIPVADSPAKGPPDAPVVVAVFSDFQ